MNITRLISIAAILPGILCAASPAPKVSGLPFFFLENRGLTDSRARYFMNRPELSAWFMQREIALALKGHKVSLLFPSAAANARIEGIDPMEGSGASFFLGSDASKWVKDVPMDRGVVYRAMWPGIDMVYAGNGRTLKSEFRVSAGADPELIRWSYSQPFHASVSADHSLSVTGEGLDMREDAPVLYQEKDGVKVSVAGSFQSFADGSTGFRVGEYDRSLPLVIDPVLTFSTFIGGSNQDQATAVALDANGNAYLAGWTNSTNFAQAGPTKWKALAGSVDAFVAKFSALGDRLVYCTYFGGSGDDRALGLAVDSAGNAFLTGYTTSPNFPVSSFLPIQATLAGKRNAFVTRLNATGNALVYSTYLGGEGTDTGNAITVDASSRAYVTGDTTSVRFPTTTGALQTTNNGGQDIFAAEINLNGTTLLWSTYVGGSAAEHAGAIALASGGKTIITGSTQSADFPSLNAVQPFTGGNQDAFVIGLLSGRALAFSTYLGGSGGTPGLPEEGNGVAVDAASNIFIAGTTSSFNFPVTSGGFQQTFGGGNLDGFLVKLDPTGRTLLYGTFIGGSSVEHVTGVALDQFGYSMSRVTHRRRTFRTSVRRSAETAGNTTASSIS